MATAIKIPDLGTNVEQVTLTAWLKKVGDRIARGDVLCEVATDKAASELESVADGTLLRQCVREGTEIATGTVIAYIGLPGEVIPELANSAAPATKPPTNEAPVADSAVGSGKWPPLLRNLAEKRGIDLASVKGTGPGGRITREDVLNAKPVASQERPGETGALSKEQQAVSRLIMKSHQEIPPTNLLFTVEMSRAMALRDKSAGGNGRKIAYDAILIYAAARVLREFPNFRRAVVMDKVVAHPAIDVACAVSVGEKLQAPVIRNADQLSLEQIDAELRKLVEKATAGGLKTEELAGGVFTISNLGMFPVQSFTAYILPGQSVVLAAGAIEERPTVKMGQLAVAPQMTLTLSVDHRLINGREAGAFIKQLKKELETL